MSNSFNELTEDEKKYFDTRGDHEPAGYSEASREDSTPESEPAEQIEQSESRSEGLGARPDEPVSERDAAENEESGDVGTSQAIEHKQTNSNKSSKRDFEKAYGVAESKRVELRAQLEEQARQNNYLQQQLQAIMAQNQKKGASQVQIPDPESDPLGYQAYRIEELNRTVREQQEYLQKQRQYQEQQMRQSQFVNAYRASAAEFAKEQSDFNEAYTFLEKARINEYIAAGYTPQEASYLLQEDEMAVAAKAFKDGANPAERIYNLARARGFASSNTNEETKLDKVSKGMQKGKTLPRSGGKNMERGYDMSQLDDMSDDEFDKLFNQLKSEAKRNGDYKKDFY